MQREVSAIELAQLRIGETENGREWGFRQVALTYWLGDAPAAFCECQLVKPKPSVVNVPAGLVELPFGRYFATQTDTTVSLATDFGEPCGEMQMRWKLFTPRVELVGENGQPFGALDVGFSHLLPWGRIRLRFPEAKSISLCLHSERIWNSATYDLPWLSKERFLKLSKMASFAESFSRAVIIHPDKRELWNRTRPVGELLFDKGSQQPSLTENQQVVLLFGIAVCRGLQM